MCVSYFLIHSAYYHNIDTSALHPYMVLLKYLFLNKNNMVCYFFILRMIYEIIFMICIYSLYMNLLFKIN